MLYMKYQSRAIYPVSETTSEPTSHQERYPNEELGWEKAKYLLSSRYTDRIRLWTHSSPFIYIMTFRDGEIKVKGVRRQTPVVG